MRPAWDTDVDRIPVVTPAAKCRGASTLESIPANVLTATSCARSARPCRQAYFEQVRAGLGDTFIQYVERVLAVTLEFPEIGSPVTDTPPELNIRRRLVQRFDVEIDYVAQGDELVVIAIFHSKRRPGYWSDRLNRIRSK